jgi:hypothetical protein
VTGGAPSGIDRMPIPMGVIAATGETHPALTEDALRQIAPDSEAVVASRGARALAVEGRVEDPMDLTQAGWGVLLPAGVDPAIVEALSPLIELRRAQVADERFFRIFREGTAAAPGQTAPQWAAARGVSLSAPVSPKRGVPYYLLIVGSPSQIPFEFQAQLDLQWAAGRLHFDTPDDYAAYAQKVVEYEKGLVPVPKRRAVVWMPRNPLDLATAMLAGTMAPEFRGEAMPGDEPIGKSQAFELATYVGDGAATKARLTEIFRGTGGTPALLFTGSHGAEWPVDDPRRQRERQGALVTQEWTRGQPLADDHYFAGRDVPADAAVHGLMMFLFACFGGGCPEKDTYYFNADGSNIRLAGEPMVASLPQALLRRGALAVIAHVDRAFSYGFEDVMGSSQAQLLRTPLELLMRGRRVGLAMEPLNQQWASLAAQLGVLLGGNTPGDPPPRPPVIAHLYIARDDARNYMVLGDPAVRLRTEAM